MQETKIMSHRFSSPVLPTLLDKFDCFNPILEEIASVKTKLLRGMQQKKKAHVKYLKDMNDIWLIRVHIYNNSTPYIWVE